MHASSGPDQEHMSPLIFQKFQERGKQHAQTATCITDTGDLPVLSHADGVLDGIVLTMD